MTTVPPATTPTCPRCGYDLAGQCAQWACLAEPGRIPPAHLLPLAQTATETPDGATCPLSGTCSECGLTFQWRLVLNPDLAGLRWYVESPRPPRRRWSALRTCLRLAYPPRFWRDVKLEVRVSPRRLAAWVFFLVAVVASVPALECVVAVMQTAQQWWGWWRSGRPLSVQGVWLTFTDNAMSAMHWLMNAVTAPPVWLIAGAALSTTFAVVFSCLPHTRSRAKVQTWLVVRTALLGLGWLPLVLLFDGALKASVMLAALACQALGIQPAALDWDGWFQAITPLWSYTWSDIKNPGPLWLPLPVAAWVFVYWWHALSRGLRMREAPAAYTACCIPAILALAACLLVNQPLCYALVGD